MTRSPIYVPLPPTPAELRLQRSRSLRRAKRLALAVGLICAAIWLSRAGLISMADEQQRQQQVMEDRR